MVRHDPKHVLGSHDGDPFYFKSNMSSKTILAHTLSLDNSRSGYLYRSNKVKKPKFQSQMSVPNEVATEINNLSEGDNALGSTATSIAVGQTTAVTAHRSPISQTLLKTGDSLIPTIDVYLAKPEIVVEGVFQSTDGPNTFSNYNVNIGLGTAMKAAKLAGVYGYRYDAVVTLQLNATRFQQGRYILAFLSTAGQLVNSAAYTAHIKAHRYSLVQITQLPHVEIDVNCDTQVSLTIPYCSAVNYETNNGFASAPGYGCPGIFFLYPMSPLTAATGSLTAEFTMWLHYENVMMMGNVVPQMARPNERSVVKKGKDVLKVEEGSTGVSSGLKLVSAAASSFATIPSLTPFMAPLSWTAGVLGSVAEALGFSRPLNVEKPMRMFTGPFPFFGNVDSFYNGQQLALTLDNHVNVDPGFGSCDKDEMAFDYMLSIPTYFSTVSWTTAQPANQSLVSFTLAPGNLLVNSTDGTAPVSSLLPVGYVASFFEQYRGGFEITIKFVKTEFHSGRLLVVYQPYDDQYHVPTPVIGDQPWLHKQIVDVRLGNEVKIALPWVSTTSWKNCSTVSGVVSIYVLDALVAPANVTSNIPILFFFNGASDLEFSVPSVITQRFHSPLSQQMDMECEFSSTTIGTMSEYPKEIAHSEACIGERITSFRQLLKKGSLIIPFQAFNTATFSMATRLSAMSLGTATTATLPVDGAWAGTDIFSHMCSIFTMHRGSVRIALLSANNDVAGGIQVALNNTVAAGTAYPNSLTTTTAYSAQQFAFQTNGTSLVVGNSATGGVLVSDPYYHINPSVINSSITNYGGQAMSVGTFVPRTRVVVRNTTTVPTVNVWRGGGDDCQFYQFISIPPIILLTTP
jgi:hypothetical protein